MARHDCGESLAPLSLNAAIRWQVRHRRLTFQSVQEIGQAKRKARDGGAMAPLMTCYDALGPSSVYGGPGIDTAAGPINVSRDAMLEGALRGNSAIKRSTIVLGPRCVDGSSDSGRSGGFP